jgi:GlcNAc-P-P-Und epimerase
MTAGGVTAKMSQVASVEALNTARGEPGRVFVTGGSGFIGTNVVNAYLAAGVDVQNFDLAPPRDVSASNVWIKGDLRDYAQVSHAVQSFDPTHIIHLGARTDLRGSRVSDYDANTIGVKSLIKVLKTEPTSVERIIFASSRMVCRIGYSPTAKDDYCPPNAYGESKVETERIVRAAALTQDWMIFRPTSIWGPWFDIPYRDFFLNVAQRRYMHPRGRRILKHFGFVLNSVSQLDRLLRAPSEPSVREPLYLADDPPIDVLDLANKISESLGKPPVRQIPYPLLKLAAIAGDALDNARRPAPLTSFRLDNLLTEMLYDLTPLNTRVGTPVYSLDDGVSITVTWLRQQGLVN